MHRNTVINYSILANLIFTPTPATHALGAANTSFDTLLLRLVVDARLTCLLLLAPPQMQTCALLACM
ncbi:MAG: hypothetical protein RSD82_12405, partial [Comamonas sp.]